MKAASARLLATDIAVTFSVLLVGILGAVPLSAAPKLLIVISVDQMRADYMETLAKESKKGWSRLLKEGAWITQSRHTQVPTETAPGHAALLTGQTPAAHGIIGNDWWDRRLGRRVRAVEDPVFGKSPSQLLSHTLGDALKARSPKSKVVSIAGKDRAAIFLGGHRPDSAVWYDYKTGQFITSSYYGELPPWAAAYNERRPVDAYFEHLSDKDSKYFKSFSEKKFSVQQDRRYEGFLLTPQLDRSVYELSLEAVRAMELGQDDNPDLLAIGFSAMDYIGHQHGPASLEVRETMRALDDTMADLLTYLEHYLGRDCCAVAVSADHGAQFIPESSTGVARGLVRLRQHDLKHQVEEALNQVWPYVNSSGEKWVLDVLVPHLYLNVDLAAKVGISKPELIRRATEALGKISSIAQVYQPDDFGDSQWAAVYRDSFYASRAGELMIRLKENIVFDDDGKQAQHGAPYDFDARVPIVFWGPGIKPGRYDAAAPVTALAPTAARILGIKDFPSRESKVLEEILDTVALLP